ncbi:hypothetical protein BDQ17DRAFT_1419115 [Cyathus striatus]|nr:hypothetical protein BDQ17DRAFT_1419115 [Cyathus striatus]
MSVLRRLQSSSTSPSFVASMPGLKVIGRIVHWLAQPHSPRSNSSEQCAAPISTKASVDQVIDEVNEIIYSTNTDSERTESSVVRTRLPESLDDMTPDTDSEFSVTETLVSPSVAFVFFWVSKRSSRAIDPKRKSMVNAIDNYLAVKKRVHMQMRDQFHQVHVFSEKVTYLDAAIEQCDGGGYRHSTVDPDTVASTRSRYYTDKQSVLQQIQQCFKKVQELQLELRDAQDRLRQLDDGGEEAAIIREFLQTLAQSEQCTASPI